MDRFIYIGMRVATEMIRKGVRDYHKIFEEVKRLVASQEGGRGAEDASDIAYRVITLIDLIQAVTEKTQILDVPQ